MEWAARRHDSLIFFYPRGLTQQTLVEQLLHEKI